ncbi:MAG: ParB/RepB/Spo0J family partition protein [Pseudomonadota bacterium]|nr:ParB/RepB/Spo0J family partition protein [Pseudomonadota bacterium]
MKQSFKKLIQSGTIKRADAMKIKLNDIYEEPGFNLREEGSDLEESIFALFEFIMSGGQVPALEVRPREGGGVWIVDGHRRYRAYRRAVTAGAPIEYIPVVAFSGNDLDRIVRIMTSAEGRPLSQLETAKGYRRLAAFGLNSEQIAKHVGKTRQHVDNLLILANANQDVQDLVKSGVVSATTAIETVRHKGEQSGKFLAAELHKAQSIGKKKVTIGTMRSKNIPKKVASQMADFIEKIIALDSTPDDIKLIAKSLIEKSGRD